MDAASLRASGRKRPRMPTESLSTPSDTADMSSSSSSSATTTTSSTDSSSSSGVGHALTDQSEVVAVARASSTPTNSLSSSSSTSTTSASTSSTARSSGSRTLAARRRGALAAAVVVDSDNNNSNSNNDNGGGVGGNDDDDDRSAADTVPQKHPGGVSGGSSSLVDQTAAVEPEDPMRHLNMTPFAATDGLVAHRPFPVVAPSQPQLAQHHPNSSTQSVPYRQSMPFPTHSPHLQHQQQHQQQYSMPVHFHHPAMQHMQHVQHMQPQLSQPQHYHQQYHPHQHMGTPVQTYSVMPGHPFGGQQALPPPFLPPLQITPASMTIPGHPEGMEHMDISVAHHLVDSTSLVGDIIDSTATPSFASVEQPVSDANMMAQQMPSSSSQSSASYFSARSHPHTLSDHHGPAHHSSSIYGPAAALSAGSSAREQQLAADTDQRLREDAASSERDQQYQPIHQQQREDSHLSLQQASGEKTVRRRQEKAKHTSTRRRDHAHRSEPRASTAQLYVDERVGNSGVAVHSGQSSPQPQTGSSLSAPPAHDRREALGDAPSAHVPAIEFPERDHTRSDEVTNARQNRRDQDDAPIAKDHRRSHHLPRQRHAHPEQQAQSQDQLLQQQEHLRQSQHSRAQQQLDQQEQRQEQEREQRQHQQRQQRSQQQTVSHEDPFVAESLAREALAPPYPSQIALGLASISSMDQPSLGMHPDEHAQTAMLRDQQATGTVPELHLGGHHAQFIPPLHGEPGVHDFMTHFDAGDALHHLPPHMVPLGTVSSVSVSLGAAAPGTAESALGVSDALAGPVTLPQTLSIASPRIDHSESTAGARRRSRVRDGALQRVVHGRGPGMHGNKIRVRSETSAGGSSNVRGMGGGHDNEIDGGDGDEDEDYDEDDEDGLREGESDSRDDEGRQGDGPNLMHLGARSGASAGLGRGGDAGANSPSVGIALAGRGRGSGEVDEAGDADQEDVDATWMSRMTELHDYYARHGHCGIARDCEESAGLGRWADRVRQLRRRGRLPEERVKQLETLGFQWDTGDIAFFMRDDDGWLERYEELRQFKEKNGHCRVPWKFAEHPMLAHWVHNQRSLFTRGMLRQERAAKLDELGFEWARPGGLNEDLWVMHMERLKQFKAAHGHCCVPRRWTADTGLARWVTRQRYMYHQGTLREERAQQLTELGFEWQVSDNQVDSAAVWSARLEELIRFKEEHGHCSVPHQWRQNIQLGYWVSTQRRLYRANRLRADRVRLLESIGFLWRLR
jgi:hypothetical protein